MKRLFCCAALIACVSGDALAQPSREEGQLLASQVRRCYKMPLNQSGDAVIEFRLLKDGTVTDVQLVKSGGLTNYIVGLAAMEAVRKCQPYKTSIVGRVRIPFLFKADTPKPPTPDKPAAKP